MEKFKKRKFNSFGEFIKELKFIIKNRDQIKKLDSGELLDAEFRQRLMMAVTEVNGCRYCSYYHSKLALKAGISQAELNSLLAGELEDCPKEETLALFYAQHWTEKKGQPEEEMMDKVKAEYGREKFETINLAVRMINFGNLSGNSFDYFLYKLSFGLLAQSS
ncbi:carboxymuconolactone decarboxylase family protein [Halanaerobium kushneri]|jgi:AhpD family alkylhydroperoxidase|uniref:Alkylhydroperoxidase AhpD family core domain-containing protein n=1 Tax=Halanaerobium kushneri TaxID=56779 RepID=A0A1N7B9Q1_9FIRM|nr:carboxymuconolactone decarboxylase family protein [Halanaerobium kushneri]SIR48026.1 alkylhydroperoxidase AhpD family core domain-containing protein [Halanaerobium kushneri]